MRLIGQVISVSYVSNKGKRGEGVTLTLVFIATTTECYDCTSEYKG
jgi:hypothetical protein